MKLTINIDPADLVAAAKLFGIRIETPEPEPTPNTPIGCTCTKEERDTCIAQGIPEYHFSGCPLHVRREWSLSLLSEPERKAIIRARDVLSVSGVRQDGEGFYTGTLETELARTRLEEAFPWLRTIPMDLFKTSGERTGGN